jgi:excisionase family DNA binding protein
MAPHDENDNAQQALTCSVIEAARLLGVGRTRAWRSAQDGSLPIVRLGRSVRVPLPALAEMLGTDADHLAGLLRDQR